MISKNSLYIDKALDYDWWECVNEYDEIINNETLSLTEKVTALLKAVGWYYVNVWEDQDKINYIVGHTYDYKDFKNACEEMEK